jgi:tetratricopeptide (TPR) repeat protein
MCSENPAYSRNIPIISLLFLAWFVYLSTLSPTIFYRDTPEFASTAFSLGISHPAGFPIYNLMAKAVTFFPMGAIPFKVNLFSSLIACLALGALYLASVTFLRVLAGPEQSDSHSWSALLPVGFMAFSMPFWGNTMLAEVYTLHTLFTVLVILGLLKWKEKDDIRYLYAAALVYGLSAGNHGTVAFYLPAILILFLFWCQHNRVRHLSLCALFFLWGFSIYMYLPIRSLTEPTFDWGNPETLQEFLFQITDQKDSHTHFDILNQATTSSTAMVEPRGSTVIWEGGLFQKIKHVGKVFITDIYRNLSLISVVGFLVGAIICFRKNKSFFLFCAVLVGINITFFTSWRGEAFLPSYIIVSLFTALLIYQIVFTRWWKPLSRNSSDEPLEKFILHKPGLFGIRWGTMVFIFIALAIPWSMIDRNYSRVDHSWNYLPETLTRHVYLTLPDRAVFVSGLSWFYYNYNQDVRRLRDDVTAVTVWDLISPHRTGLLTTKRYPNLFLPDNEKHDFKSLEGISNYAKDFVKANANSTPVVMEQNSTMYEQTHFTSHWQPYRNILLKYGSPTPSPADKKFSHKKSWEEFKSLLETELSRPNSGRDIDWLNNPKAWMYSMRQYFHDTGKYDLEREVLTTIGGFLGQGGNRQWAFQYVDNLIADHRLGKAKILLDQIVEMAPESFEAWLGKGLLSRAQGKFRVALDSFQKAEKFNPRSFRVHLEIAKTLENLRMDQLAQAAFLKTQSYVTNVRELILLRQAMN